MGCVKSKSTDLDRLKSKLNFRVNFETDSVPTQSRPKSKRYKSEFPKRARRQLENFFHASFTISTWYALLLTTQNYKQEKQPYHIII